MKATYGVISPRWLQDAGQASDSEMDQLEHEGKHSRMARLVNWQIKDLQALRFASYIRARQGLSALNSEAALNARCR
jgi:hypothetical protein